MSIMELREVCCRMSRCRRHRVTGLCIAYYGGTHILCLVLRASAVSRTCIRGGFLAHKYSSRKSQCITEIALSATQVMA